jgi:hypothetical protein
MYTGRDSFCPVLGGRGVPPRACQSLEPPAPVILLREGVAHIAAWALWIAKHGARILPPPQSKGGCGRGLAHTCEQGGLHSVSHYAKE